jgi:2'-5' RNA ligase
LNLDWQGQEEEFNKVWATRYQPPSITDSWVDNDWAKGRTNYLTFLIRVRESRIVERIKNIQAMLSDYNCIDLFPDKYLHITVKELNYFLVSEKHFTDEYTVDELPEIVRGAKEKLKVFKPFELKLKNLNNFKSAVCVEAHDGGVIRSINGALLQIPSVQKLRNDYPLFLPHVSIAQYKSSEDYEKMVKHLELNRVTEVGSLDVDAIELVIAELPIRGRYPQLKTLEEFRL